jgi:5-methylcytosine-specific restriction protein A
MQVRSVYLSEHPLCLHCQHNKKLTKATQIDHIVPLFRGGLDDWDNYQPLCDDCHKGKTAQDMGHHKQGCDASGYPPSWAG